ncbi:type-F conjugative transfer system pilin assembly thiol-disulfide isomerase TrbB [Providencia rustigianii]|uniref:type-F conjugative transfer system pilin assembly thiol-disulfide isomerase TrbB n=1 Tax=Providencia rustigianii TaxID=158850 RepID=UPI0038B3C91C
MRKYSLLLVCLMSVWCHASVRDDIAALEAHKTSPSSSSSVVQPNEVNTSTKSIKSYRLPNGQWINLNDYTLVLFMQSGCGYCQQFDPQLAQLSAQMGLKVFPYTLDGLGDSAFPNAIPAPADVVRTFFGTGMPVVTPSVFLVEVNTLKTYPLLQGLTDMPDVMNRIHHNLMIATQ